MLPPSARPAAALRVASAAAQPAAAAALPLSRPRHGGGSAPRAARSPAALPHSPSDGSIGSGWESPRRVHPGVPRGARGAPPPPGSGWAGDGVGGGVTIIIIITSDITVVNAVRIAAAVPAPEAFFETAPSFFRAKSELRCRRLFVVH